MAEQWLSIVEYARTFAVSDMTVRRRIKTGRLRAVLREGKYYIPLSACEGQTAGEAEGEAEESLGFDAHEDAAIMQQALPYQSAAPTMAAPYGGLPANHHLSRNPDERSENTASRTGASFKTLPVQIVQSLQKGEQTVIDTQGLLQYCDQSLTRINSIERHLQEGYQLRLQNVENQLKIKDGIIAQLKQQVEDLQMLVKLMEQNPKALVAPHLR